MEKALLEEDRLAEGTVGNLLDFLHTPKKLESSPNNSAVKIEIYQDPTVDSESSLSRNSLQTIEPVRKSKDTMDFVPH